LAGNSVERVLPPQEQRRARGLGTRANKTRETILRTARELFLSHGYNGTSVDDIVAAVKISRGSFYNYFESKAAILLADSVDADRLALAKIDELERLPPGWTQGDLRVWVKDFIAFLDEYGWAFAIWLHASAEDQMLREASLQARLRQARRLGRHLNDLREFSIEEGKSDPQLDGAAFLVLFERFWEFWRVSGAPFSEDEVVNLLTKILFVWLHQGAIATDLV
jgi:AcrR family transcriptional regulator